MKCLECTTGTEGGRSHAVICTVAHHDMRFVLEEQGQKNKRTIDKQRGSEESPPTGLLDARCARPWPSHAAQPPTLG